MIQRLWSILVILLVLTVLVLGKTVWDWHVETRDSRVRGDFLDVFAGVVHYEGEEAIRLPESISFFGREGRVSLSAYKGRYVLLNIWATWCPPCVMELPSLDRLAQRSDPSRLKIFAVSIDENKTPADVFSFVEDNRLGGVARYIDRDGGLVDRLPLRGMPTTFLIGPDGRVLYRFEGDADWSGIEARTSLEKMIENHEKGASPEN